VQLTATTEFGCASTAQKIISVIQSPSAAFTNSATCYNVPVNFNGPSSNNIYSWYWQIGNAYYQTTDVVHTFKSSANYPVSLVVTGTNECVATTSKIINVPKVLTPGFSVVKNCIENNTVFTDITQGDDQVAIHDWVLEGSTNLSGSSVEFPFTSTGSKNVKLNITSEAGCHYTVTKNVIIALPPQASFTASQETGGIPLKIEFINASENATHYNWDFSDGGTTSADVSPEHIFNNITEYNVELTAINDQGCEDKASKIIKAVLPVNDVDLKLMTITENNDGTLKVIVTVQNKGNTTLENLPVEIDVSGKITLREIIKNEIFPATQYNLVLSSGIRNDSDLIFICADAILSSDLSPQGNKICSQIQDREFIFSFYPNPVQDQLNVEWISTKDTAVKISLIDTMGKKLLESSFSAISGLNQKTLPVNNIGSGLYLLVLKNGNRESIQRIFISEKN
jgi:PKD repeat protein